jgi:hypothetical protein
MYDKLERMWKKWVLGPINFLPCHLLRCTERNHWNCRSGYQMSFSKFSCILPEYLHDFTSAPPCPLTWHYIRFMFDNYVNCWSQWPRGLRRRSSDARLLRFWVQIPRGTWMFVCCDCCLLSGRGLCDGLITRPEESYQLWRVVVCDQETSRKRGG